MSELVFESWALEWTSGCSPQHPLYNWAWVPVMLLACPGHAQPGPCVLDLQRSSCNFQKERPCSKCCVHTPQPSVVALWVGLPSSGGTLRQRAIQEPSWPVLGGDADGLCLEWFRGLDRVGGGRQRTRWEAALCSLGPGGRPRGRGRPLRVRTRPVPAPQLVPDTPTALLAHLPSHRADVTAWEDFCVAWSSCLCPLANDRRSSCLGSFC